MSFDRIAPHYRWMEFVLAGEKLQRCRTAFLDRIASAQDILIVGVGHGRFLAELAANNKSARITCIDASAQMLGCARERLRRHNFLNSRIEFLQRDLLRWTPPQGQFDVIASHFFLDCFAPDQLDSIISRIAASARPKAIWLIADFFEPAQGCRKWRARAILWAMYRFFGVVTRLPASCLTAPDPFLQQNGFELRERRFADWQLLRTDLWQRDCAA